MSVEPGRKPAPAPRRRPPGTYVWALLVLGVVAGLEVAALLTRQWGWTLSYAVWWAEGDLWSTRWWLTAPTLFAFILWMGLHFLFRPHAGEASVVDGGWLLAMLVAALAVGAVGAAAALLR